MDERIRKVNDMLDYAKSSYDDALVVHGEDHQFTKARKVRYEVLKKVMVVLLPTSEDIKEK